MFSAVLAVPLFLAFRNYKDALWFWSLLFTQTLVIYSLTIIAFVLGSLAGWRRHLAGILAKEYAGNFPPAAYEYRSRLSLFGLPLVHVRIGDRFGVLRGPVKAWIAIGLLPFGAIALGLFPLGAISLGVWADVGLAVGWQVFCGCGVAWNAAMGGMAFAHDFALGGIVHAAQANTEIARQFIRQNLFFRCAKIVSNHSIWLTLAWVIPLALKSRIVARARRRREQKNS